MDWKIKNDVEMQGSSNGFWYDLVDGGYVKPEEVLDDLEQLNKLEDAIKLVHSFERMLDENNLINEF